METRYLEPGHDPYCKGCGHPLVLRALGEALGRLGIPPADVAIVTDIGCVGLADGQIVGPHPIHTTHGRSTAFAARLALAGSILGATAAAGHLRSSAGCSATGRAGRSRSRSSPAASTTTRRCPPRSKSCVTASA